MSTNVNEDEQRQPGNVQGILLVAIGLLSTMAVILIAPAVPVMMQAFSNTNGFQQLVVFSLTCPALCVAILSPFAGAVIDRLGRRKILIASLIAYPILGTAPLYLTSLTQIIISRLGVGVAEAVLLSSSITMLGDFFSDHQREKFLAINTAIASLSATAFFAIGGALASHNWRTPYVVYSIALLFLVAVVLFTWEPPRKRTHQELKQVAMADGPFPFVRFFIICLVTIAGAVTFMIPQIEIGVISAAHGFKSPAIAGTIGAIGSIAMPIGAFVFNKLRKHKVSLPLLIVVAFALGGTGLIIMGAMTSIPLITIGMIVHEFGCGFMLTGLMIWVLGFLAYEYRGKGTGAYFSSFFIGQPISGFLFGFVQHGFHGDAIKSFFAFGSAAIIIALIILLSVGLFSGFTQARKGIQNI